MFINDVKKVIPYGSIASMATLQIPQTIFQKFLLKLVEVFKSIGEYFNELSTWKKKPTTCHVKSHQKNDLHSLPLRVDDASLKSITPPAFSNINHEEKKISENNVSPWADILKEHKTDLAIIAGAAIFAGGVAYLTYCYSCQAAPAAEVISGTKKLFQATSSTNISFSQCLTDLADTSPKFSEPVDKIINAAANSISANSIALIHTTNPIAIYNKGNISAGHSPYYHSLSSQLKVLSSFLPSFETLGKLATIGYFYDKARQFWDRRKVDKKMSPQGSEPVSENKLLTMALKDQFGHQMPAPQKKNINEYVNEFEELKIHFNETIDLANKYVRSINEKMTASHENSNQTRYEINESVSSLNQMVSNLTDLSYVTFESQNIEIENQSELLLGIIEFLSTIGFHDDISALNKLIDMLCARVSHRDPTSFKAASKLLNKYLDEFEDQHSLRESILKLISVTKIYEFKAGIEKYNLSIENINDPAELDQRYKNFELTKKYIEENYMQIMLLANSDDQLAEIFHALGCTANYFFNNNIINNENSDNIQKDYKDYLDILDYIVFNNGKSPMEKLEELDSWELFSDKLISNKSSDDEFENTTNEKSLLDTSEKQTSENTPKNTPKVKLRLTPSRQVKITPDYKLHIEENKKKLCNELKGKLKPVDKQQNIDEDEMTNKRIDLERNLKKTKTFPLSPQSKLTISINDNLNKIIELKKEIIEFGSDEDKVKELDFLMIKVKKYFDNTNKTINLNQEFFRLLNLIDDSLKKLFDINIQIRNLENLGEDDDTANGIDDQLKALNFKLYKEKENFSNIKISFLTLGKNTANSIPLDGEKDHLSDLKPIPPKHDTKRKSNFRTFKISTYNEKVKHNKIENTLSEIFDLTMNIINSNLEEGIIVEKQQALINQILTYFNNECNESEKIRLGFIQNQELVVETFLKVIELERKIAACKIELQEAEKANDAVQLESGPECKRSPEKKDVDLEALRSQMLKLGKEFNEAKNDVMLYRKLYVKYSEEIAKIPQLEEENGQFNFNSPPPSPYRHAKANNK